MKEMSILTSKQILAWAMGFDTQRLQTESLGETKDFDAIKSRKMEQKAKPVAKTQQQMK